MPQGNPERHPGRNRTLDKGSLQAIGLLAERVGRNGKERHRSNHRRKVIRGWTARCFLLLLTRFRGPERPPVHISYSGRPARTEIQRIPIELCPARQVGSKNRLRIAVQPNEQIDRPTPPEIRRFDRDCHRRLGRVQRRGTCFCDPIRSRAVRVPDPGCQILPQDRKSVV